MRAVLISVATLLFSASLLLTGHGLQTILVPIRAGLEGFSTVEIGLIGSSYYVGFVLGCLVAPYAILVAGHIRAYTAFVALASAAALAHPLFVDPLGWAAMRVVTGLSLAGLYLIIESWLNERATNDNRGVVMSAYIFVNFTVITVGQLLVAFGDPASFALFSFAAILFSLAAIPIALTRSTAPGPVTMVRFRVRHLYRLSPAGFVGCFMVGVANGAFWGLGPTFATAFGLTATGAAIFMSVAVLSGAAMQWPVGRISDRVDRRSVLVALCIAAAVGSVTLVLVANARPDYLPWAGFLFGAFALPGYAVAAAHAFDYVDPAGYVEASAGLLLANGFGSVIGPILAAWLMRETSTEALFAFIAMAEILLALFVAGRMRVRESPSDEVKSDFDLAVTAPIVAVATPEPLEESPDIVVSPHFEPEPMGMAAASESGAQDDEDTPAAEPDEAKEKRPEPVD